MNDLQTLLRPRLGNRIPVNCMILLLWAGLTLLGVKAWQISEQTAAAEEVHARAQARTERAARLARSAAIAPEVMREWGKLKDEIGFPWSDFFDVVERATSPQIELLEMVPEKQGKALVLRGEARDSKALHAFLAELAKQPEVREAVLARRQFLDRGGLVTLEFEIRSVLKQS